MQALTSAAANATAFPFPHFVCRPNFTNDDIDMKKSFLQIQRQIEQLERQAEALKNAEVADVVKRIKDAIKVYGLTASDLGLAAPARKAAGGRVGQASPAGRKTGKKLGKVAPKFRDDAGNTWTGRGNQPRWLRAALEAGRKLEDFRI